MQKKQNKKYDACLKTPFANLGLCFDNDVLVSVDFVAPGVKAKPVSAESKDACRQISQYCQSEPTKQFNIKLNAVGTEFQQRVWRALQKIPAGEVITYGELAKQLKTSARAVGNACRKNPIPVVIPCHRVVSKTGLGGFAGKTTGKLIKAKEWLLLHEKVLSGH